MRSARYFWLVRIVVTRTSGGTAMNASSMAPRQRHRPLDQALDLVEQRRDRPRAPAPAPPPALGTAGDQRPPLGPVEDHLGRAQPDDVVGEVAHRERLGRHEAVAARLVAGRDAADA